MRQPRRPRCGAADYGVAVSVGVGSAVWVFDINRRRYHADKSLGQGPIWREHWDKQEIVGETTRSWITNRHYKIPKKGADKRTFSFSEEEINRAAFVYEHRYKISDAVNRTHDYEKLLRIAEIVGYPAPHLSRQQQGENTGESNGN